MCSSPLADSTTTHFDLPCNHCVSAVVNGRFRLPGLVVSSRFHVAVFQTALGSMSLLVVVATHMLVGSAYRIANG
jgi:hypothetical protein